MSLRGKIWLALVILAGVVSLLDLGLEYQRQAGEQERRLWRDARALGSLLQATYSTYHGQVGGNPGRFAPELALERRVNNNTVLKKLRIAFSLKTDDIVAIMTEQKYRVSVPEVTAMMRAPDHKNYRECGDQFLRYFLRGLTERAQAERQPPAPRSADAGPRHPPETGRRDERGRPVPGEGGDRH